MEFTLLHIVCIVVLFSEASLAQDDFVVELKKHIEHLEAKIERLESKHDAEIKSLQEATDIRIAELTSEIKGHKNSNALQAAKFTRELSNVDQRITVLESKNRGLIKDVRRCNSKTLRTRNVLLQKTKKSDVVAKDETKTFEIKTGRRIMSRNSKLKSGDIDSTTVRRALHSDLNVAFTAYLDHDENGIGAGQTLKFNRILLNDGNGYNVHSGMFTVPIAGVYSFTFFIGQRNQQESYAALFVNSKNMLDAVVETYATREDGQGGNSAVLKVTAGDIVFVKMLLGNHVEGSDSLRITSFSGFLLYPTEDGSVVVGK